MCDWDLCVAPTDVGWWEWLCKIDGRKDPMPVRGKTTHYNLGEYFAWFKHQHGIDPQSYWDNLHLYDTMGTVEGAGRVLNRWGRFGNNLSVGSVTRGGHISSKFRHVKRVASDFSFEPGSVMVSLQQKRNIYFLVISQLTTEPKTCYTFQIVSKRFTSTRYMMIQR